MTPRTEKTEATRQQLSDAIVDAIRSWPEHPREIFIQAHYVGRSPEEIALATGLNTADIRRILDHYESKLRIALKPFRYAREVPDSELCLCCATGG